MGLMEDCVVRLNEDLQRIQTWCDTNKLKLNPLKTVAMICTRREVDPKDFPPVG